MLLIPFLGWVVGVVLLWLSRTWTARKKAIGTLLALGVGVLALLSLSSPVEWIRPLLVMVLTIPTVIDLGVRLRATPTRCPPPADARLATEHGAGPGAKLDRGHVGHDDHPHQRPFGARNELVAGADRGWEFGPTSWSRTIASWAARWRARPHSSGEGSVLMWGVWVTGWVDRRRTRWAASQ